MVIAGVIASYGVTEANTILIVGAMAVSPDLLPITAIGVGILGRRWRLVVEASLTLIVGLAVAAGAAAVSAAVQDGFDLIGSGFSLDSASATLGGLTTVSHETVVVAFVAGVAGMLALETRASSAVGVAVSVTTIPAAAYLGLAAGIGELSTVTSTFGLLAVNVVMMVVGALLTLSSARAEAAALQSSRQGQLIGPLLDGRRGRRCRNRVANLRERILSLARGELADFVLAGARCVRERLRCVLAARAESLLPPRSTPPGLACPHILSGVGPPEARPSTLYSRSPC